MATRCPHYPPTVRERLLGLFLCAKFDGTFDRSLQIFHRHVEMNLNGTIAVRPGRPRNMASPLHPEPGGPVAHNEEVVGDANDLAVQQGRPE